MTVMLLPSGGINILEYFENGENNSNKDIIDKGYGEINEFELNNFSKFIPGNSDYIENDGF